MYQFSWDSSIDKVRVKDPSRYTHETVAECVSTFWHQFLVFSHVTRRPCWYTKQWQKIAQVLHNNSIKFPKYFLHICSVHQHGFRDIMWKPRYHELESHWIPVHETFKSKANQHSEILRKNLGGSRKHLNYQSTSYCFHQYSHAA